MRLAMTGKPAAKDSTMVREKLSYQMLGTTSATALPISLNTR